MLPYAKQNILPYEIYFHGRSKLSQLNNEIFNTNDERLKRIQSNILFVALAELTVYTGGLRIKYAVQRILNFFTPLVGEKYTLYYNANFWLIIPILILLAFMRLTCRNAMSVSQKAVWHGNWAL